MGIEIIYNEEMLKTGIKPYIEWIPSKAPHIIIFGNTGSGKTYFCKLLLGKIALHEPEAQIYVCDFKGDDDFSFLADCERFYRYYNCTDGMQEFYRRFQARQNGTDKSRNMLVLYFDEWAAYLNSNDDKKILEAEKRKLANILMLGRSFNVHVIISQQRPDSQYFQASRDNFNLVIGLNNLSEEAKEMFFHEFKKQMFPDRRRGSGYMITNGTNFTAVQVPKITKWEKLHSTIKDGVTR